MSTAVRRANRETECDVFLSIVLPFYKRAKELETTLKYNYLYFERTPIEVILAMDEPTELESVFNLASYYKTIKWHIIVNDQDHVWRNPAKAINVGIRHAIGKAVMVASPESIIVDDPLKVAARVVDSDHFAIGRIVYATYSELGTSSADELFELHQGHAFVPTFWGSLVSRRENFAKVGGYDESLVKWGGDDSNIRLRFMLGGLRMMPVPNLRLIHLAKDRRRWKLPPEGASSHTEEELERIFSPTSMRANAGERWGRSFARVALDWRSAP